ncbi:MAG TPA: class I SAM-dependent methyltransferase [Thermoanaerobaculia bacterium]|nr:class I SAM-dependent methyltransferase [Thermoanaerobaculia bacterium]
MSGIDALLAQARRTDFPIALHLPDGRLLASSDAAPLFTIQVHRDEGTRALESLAELALAESYVRGDFDVEGEFIRALTLLRSAFDDTNLWLKTWRRTEAVVRGKDKLNRAWVAKHYDSGNIQLFGQDRDYHIYTPGLYDGDDDTLEAGAERKLAAAFTALGLQSGDELLEVGFGWGGFTRFAGRRGVQVTGLTLSRDQLAFTQGLIAEEKIDAQLIFQDFFSYAPGRRYAAISVMGVMEHLADYPRVISRLAPWLKPGGRVYLDFAAATERVATSSFITKHIWPGTFRMVYLPELIEVVTRSPFEIVALYNDRRNYHLWGKKTDERWVENREAIIAAHGVETWRMLRVLSAGTAASLDSPDHSSTAYRLLLELPADLVAN